jgi:hypothetical protein
MDYIVDPLWAEMDNDHSCSDFFLQPVWVSLCWRRVPSVNTVH